MNGTPGRYEAQIAPKAGTTPALKADHERKAVATRIPYLDVLNGSDNAAELHGTPHMRLPLKNRDTYLVEKCSLVDLMHAFLRREAFSTSKAPLRAAPLPEDALKSACAAPTKRFEQRSH